MRNCFVDKDHQAIVDLVPSYEMGLKGGWIITRINVPEISRGKGVGSKMLREVTAEADQEKQILYLEPIPSGGLSYSELCQWYMRHGFRWNQYGLMERRPA